MKTIKRTFQTFSTIVLTAMLFIACSENDEFAEDLNNTPTEEHIANCATMYLEGSKKDYDATRNTTTTWEEGDKLHLQFKVGSKYVNGVATYQAESQDWNVQYYGTLTSGEEATCEVYQFINTGESSRTIVDLDQHSIIYADKAATYIYEDDVLKITANLTPMTGRIRFKADAKTNFRLSGLTYYTSYDIVSNTFIATDFKTTTSQTGNDGYSSYFYLVIPEGNNNKLCFDDYDNCVSFTRTLSGNALQPGHSGFLNVPTLDNCKGWDLFTYKEFTYSNITFRMIRVLTETSHYYVGETEVTQELWKAIMGTNPSTFTGEKNLPVESMTWDDCRNFISKLNEKIGVYFYMPTNGEWLFAAKGGGADKGYAYCGSNTLDDVAWYSGNSENKTHPVKTKIPNEIGIYDMNGNVHEWTINAHVSGGYTYYYAFFGGSYDAYSCPKNNSTNGTSQASSNIGIRLFLKD